MARAKCVHPRSDGEPCELWPIHGSTICHKHGGANRHIKAAAKDREFKQLARAAFAKQGVQLAQDDDPFDVMVRLAQETLEFKDFIRGHVDRLDEIRYDGGPGAGEQLRSEVRLYADMLRDTTQAYATLIKLGIEERLARIRERRATEIVGAVIAGLQDYGLTDDQLREAKPHVARRLRAITGS